MKDGKIGAEGFKRLFQGRFGSECPEQLVAPGFGKDISLVDLGNSQAMAMASDPLSYIPSLGAKKSAELSVYLVANDMATTAVMPQYFQMVLNLNEDFTESLFEEYWSHLHQICQQLNISITGGHTGVIPMQNTTIMGGGTMIAVAPTDHFIRPDGVQEGDVLLMSKKAAISSTAILGLHFKETAHNLLGDESCSYLEELFNQISVIKEGDLAGKYHQQSSEKPIHAMHDVTEGGILGAVYEMAQANQKGVVVHTEKIPLGSNQQLICDQFQLNPLEIIGAGSMLMAVDPKAVEDLNSYYQSNGIDLTEIGVFTSSNKDCILKNSKGEQKFIPKEKDPYWEAFFTAYQNGWK